MIAMKLADITLRLARRPDVPTLAAMSRDLIETGLGWHYRPERVAKFLDDPETATVVACDRERTVGFAIMQLFDERAHLVLLAVRPSHQQRGIGRRTRSIGRRGSPKPCACKATIAAAKRRSA